MVGRKPKKRSPEDQQKFNKMQEYQRRMDNGRSLTTAEYTALLHEVRKNYLLSLAMLSIEGKTKGTGACIHLVEKAHYLLESVEGKPTHRVDVKHSVDEQTRTEFRKMLSDPKNIANILEVEGIILENVVGGDA